MSFGGQSNTPWQRMSTFHQGNNQSGMFLQQHVPPQAAFGHTAIFSQGGTGASIAYPQQRTASLNPVAFQQTSSGGQTQSNSIGTVTKINNECGLINDEVFFYRNACKGVVPKLGDRVMFEATFSTTGQFKWNATRIQLMGNTMSHQSQQQLPPLMGSGSGGKGGSGYNAVPPPNEYQLAQMQQQRHGSPLRGDRRHVRNDRERDRRDHDRIHRSRDRDDDERERERKRRREDHDRSRERNIAALNRGHDRDRERDRARDDNKADHNVERRDRERERERERDRDRERERDRDKDRAERTDRSPHRPGTKGRRTRTIRRYMVQIPKNILAYKSADLQELRQRYSTLYIPSDFFHANILWPKVFTLENTFSLRRPCQFHIMHHIVESPFEQTNEVLEPSDADYIYSAKVMLMACTPIAELYQKCFEDDENENEHNTVHPSRLISFLVGTRGRNEPMAIGGPWSPSLDGENPDKDPAVLIRTAIRTCKALTGIDLSQCTQWYRFVELHYHRQDYKKKDSPSRIETVVIYLPDVHSCMPNATQWQELGQVYKNAVENVIARKSVAAKATVTPAAAEVTVPSSTTGSDGADTSTGTTSSANAATEDPDTTVMDAEVIGNDKTDGEAVTSADTGADSSADVIIVEEVDMSADGDTNADQKNDPPAPTHYSQLDLKSMKAQDIRDELTARNLSPKGARNIIMARLAKALNTEKTEEKITKKTTAKAGAVKSQPPAAKTPNVDIKKNETIVEVVEVTDENEKNKDEEPEDQEEWNDVIDVDMSDIVILDEYDSSKNPEDAPKELNEKEKNQLIRRYTLPTAEHIIVHPSKTAKSGKFDCSIMSLSVLLDYGPADTKERFFEVSLFAELFNEMLMRDFGFNIYKEMYLFNDDNNESADTGKDKKEEGTNGVNKNDDVPTMAVEEESKASIEMKTNNDGADEKSVPERRASKRSVDVEPDSDVAQSLKTAIERKRRSTVSNGRDKDKESNTSKKMTIVKPHLLLSFIYFDTTHCGYIFEKDLEDLFSILGLNLSRSQIRKVLGKLSIRQAFYYRKLTDREETSEPPQTIEDGDYISSEEFKKIALGNTLYLAKENEIGSDSNIEENTAVNNTDTKKNDGLVNYNGIVIHVGKLLEQIKRSEKNYGDLEKLYNDLRKQHTELQRDHSKSSGKIKDLQSEVKSLSRKLSDADQDLFTLNRKYRDQHSTLSFIHNRVAPYFSREKEKDHKSDSSRDKDADKDAKEKGKEGTKSNKEKVKDKERDKEKTKEHNKEADEDMSEHNENKNQNEENEINNKNEENQSESENEKSSETAQPDNEEEDTNEG